MLIDSKNISKKSLFKLLLIGLGVGSLLLWLLLSILSSFASGNISLSLESTPGFAQFLEVLATWPLFALLWIGFTWLSLMLGLTIVNRFTSLTLKTKD